VHQAAVLLLLQAPTAGMPATRARRRWQKLPRTRTAQLQQDRWDAGSMGRTTQWGIPVQEYYWLQRGHDGHAPPPLTEQRRQREAVVQLAGGQHRPPLLGLAVMQRSGAVGEQPGLEGAVGPLGCGGHSAGSWVDSGWRRAAGACDALQGFGLKMSPLQICPNSPPTCRASSCASR